MESKVYEGRGRDRTESCCMKECNRIYGLNGCLLFGWQFKGDKT